jgi:hypothetical protein
MIKVMLLSFFGACVNKDIYDFDCDLSTVYNFLHRQCIKINPNLVLL